MSEEHRQPVRFDERQAGTVEYLRAIFPEVEGRGFIEVRSFSKGEPTRHPKLAGVEAAARFVVQQQAGNIARNIHVGLALRSHPKKRGDAENLVEVWTLWADVDFDPADQQGSHEEIAMVLKSFPFEPSMVVFSGGGLHLYWLLDESWPLADAVNRNRLHDVERGIADVLGADPRACDPARILRVPGTLNYPDEKKRRRGRRAARCFLKQRDNARRYGFEDFADLFELRGRTARGSSPGPTKFRREIWSGELPTSVERLLGHPNSNRLVRLRRRWQGSKENLRGYSGAAPGDSEVDQSIATFLALEAVTGSQIEHALRWRRHELGLRAHGAVYYERTVGKALASAQECRMRRTRCLSAIADAAEDLDQLRRVARPPE